MFQRALMATTMMTSNTAGEGAGGAAAAPAGEAAEADAAPGDASAEVGGSAGQGGAADQPQNDEVAGDKAGDEAAGDDDDSLLGSKRKGKEAKEEAPAGAPEAYELTMPEGFSTDEGMMAEFQAAAREMNLSNDQAQAMLAFGPKLIEAHKAGEQAAFREQQKGWADTMRADREFGGANLDKTLDSVAAVIDHYGGEPLFDLIIDKGYGSHPAVLTAFGKIAQDLQKAGLIGEDGTISAEPSSVPKTLAERLHPNM